MQAPALPFLSLPPLRLLEAAGDPARVAALKEGALAVRALRSGAQVLALRRGGLREATFCPPPPGAAFALLETGYHGARASAQARLEVGGSAAEALESYDPKGLASVAVRALAVCDEAWALPAEAEADALDLAAALAPWHAHDPRALAEARLAAEPRRAITIMLLRAVALQGVATDVVEGTWGCRSWATADRAAIEEALRCEPEPGGRRAFPALSQERWEQACDGVRQTLDALGCARITPPS